MATTTHSQVPVPSEWIADEVLEREGLAIEPVVMLAEVDGQPVVRKLTVSEKLAYAERAGESVFADSGEELDDVFEQLADEAEAGQRR